MKPGDDLIGPRPAGPGADPARFRNGRVESVRVLRVRAVVDAAAAAELRREARALLARSGAPIVVDLTGVRAVEPTHDFVVRDLAYEAGEADVELRVVRGPRPSETTRTLLGDEALFEIYPTLDAAVRGRAPDRGRVAASHRERAPRVTTPGSMLGELVDRAGAARSVATRLIEQAARAHRRSSAVGAGPSSRETA